MHYWQASLIGDTHRLRAMQPGWDGPGSGRPCDATIDRAASLVTEVLAELPDAKSPYLMPAGDGSLQIEWDSVHAKLEFCLEPDGSFDFWSRDLRTGEETEGEGDEALKLFRRWAQWAACDGERLPL